MIVRCCDCGEEYDFDSNVYEVVPIRSKRKFQTAKLLRCPTCGSEHAITFTPIGKFKKKALKLHKVRNLDLLTYYVTLCATRIANASRVWQAACDAGVTNWDKTADFIFATTIGTSKGPIARAYKLQWRNKTDNPTGAFTDVGATGDITYNAVTDLVDGNAVTSGEASGCTCDQTNWQDGLENEEDNILPDSGTFELLDEYYSEFQWALSCDDALDTKEYEFQLYDVTEGTAIGIGLATITIAGGVLHERDISESFGMGDAIARTTSFGRDVSESLGVGDGLGQTGSFIRSPAESLGVGDVIERIKSSPRDLSESFSLDDTIQALLTFGRDISESLGIGDALERVGSYIREPSESFSVADAVEGEIVGEKKKRKGWPWHYRR